jgi:hypothetical protein
MVNSVEEKLFKTLLRPLLLCYIRQLIDDKKQQQQKTL